jgi:large subunit ribosomal protein L15
MVGFEGGQMPLIRRIPKRGFNNNAFRKVYEIVNLWALEKYFNDGDKITPEILKEKGLIDNLSVKILGRGEMDIPYFRREVIL